MNRQGLMIRPAMSKLIVILITTAITLPFPSTTSAYKGRLLKGLVKVITRHRRALSPSKIDELVKMAAQPKGTRAVGKALGQMNLPKEVLEDAYLRIALHQGKLERSLAERWFYQLRGAKGFRSALSKVIGHSAAKTKGHLNEIAIAAEANYRGLRVGGIGVPYRDPLKASLTDIDLKLSSAKRSYAIEVKAYSPETRLPLDHIRADFKTLQSYQRDHRKVVTVFSFRHKPRSPHDLNVLKLEAKRHQVHLIFGDPSSQAEQLKVLDMIQ